MLKFAQHGPTDPEAGGILLGREIVGSNDLVVDDATIPMDGDQRTRCSFHRSGPGHQQLILNAWRDSDGTCGYLGEWHTHPEARPEPSIIDRRDWARRLVEDHVEGDVVLFLIVGTEELAVWMGARRSRVVRLLGRQTIPINYGR